MLRSILHWMAYRLGLDPRGLFVYFDGSRRRYGDPLVMARAVWSIAGFEPDKIRIAMVAAKDNGDGFTVAKCYGEIAEQVRIAFGLADAESGGLTDLECVNLLDRFESYLGDLKKNGRPSPTGDTATPVFPLPDISGFDLTKPSSVAG